MLPRAQMQCIVRNIVLNVTQQIFVRRDSKSGRSILPLNLKGAASVELAKAAIGRSSVLIWPLPRMPGKWQPATNNDTSSEQNDQDLSHGKYVFSVMMRRRRVLDSTYFTWQAL